VTQTSSNSSTGPRIATVISKRTTPSSEKNARLLTNLSKSPRLTAQLYKWLVEALLVNYTPGEVILRFGGADLKDRPAAGGPR
jgi:hypothetical protein